MQWLRGEASPELASVRGGDKGVYAIPAVLRNCGTEMYTLATARHTIAFPELGQGRPFSPEDDTIIYTRVDVGLDAIGWKPRYAIDNG